MCSMHLPHAWQSTYTYSNPLLPCMCMQTLVIVTVPQSWFAPFHSDFLYHDWLLQYTGQGSSISEDLSALNTEKEKWGYWGVVMRPDRYWGELRSSKGYWAVVRGIVWVERVSEGIEGHWGALRKNGRVLRITEGWWVKRCLYVIRFRVGSYHNCLVVDVYHIPMGYNGRVFTDVKIWVCKDLKQRHLPSVHDDSFGLYNNQGKFKSIYSPLQVCRQPILS